MIEYPVLHVFTDEQMDALKRWGWRFCQIGPTSFAWVMMDEEGKAVNMQGDHLWVKDINILSGLEPI